MLSAGSELSEGKLLSANLFQSALGLYSPRHGRKVHHGELEGLLFTASVRGDLIEVQRLLKEYPEIDVNVTDDAGQTPVHLLCDKACSEEAAQRVKEKRPEANGSLFEKVTVETLELLIERGADAGKPTDLFGLTPLHYLCYRVARPIPELGLSEEEAEGILVKCADVLISAGADVNTRTTTFGESPLHALAAKGGSPALGEFLVEKGADLNLKSATGLTPLATLLKSVPSQPDDVEKERFKKLAELFIKKGAVFIVGSSERELFSTKLKMIFNLFKLEVSNVDELVENTLRKNAQIGFRRFLELLCHLIHLEGKVLRKALNECNADVFRKVESNGELQALLVSAIATDPNLASYYKKVKEFLEKCQKTSKIEKSKTKITKTSSLRI